MPFRRLRQRRRPRPSRLRPERRGPDAALPQQRARPQRRAGGRVLDPVLNTTPMADGLASTCSRGMGTRRITSRRTARSTSARARRRRDRRHLARVGSRDGHDAWRARQCPEPRELSPLTARAEELSRADHVSARWWTGPQTRRGRSNEVRVSMGPRISAVQDVPGDQGGAVRLTLQPAYFDVAGSVDPATSYTVYARVSLPRSSSRLPSPRGPRRARPRTARSRRSRSAIGASSRRPRRSPRASRGRGKSWPASARSSRLSTSCASTQSPTPARAVPVVGVRGGRSRGSEPVVAVGRGLRQVGGQHRARRAAGDAAVVSPGTHNALSWQPSAAEDFSIFVHIAGSRPPSPSARARSSAPPQTSRGPIPPPARRACTTRSPGARSRGQRERPATPSVTTDVDGGAAPTYEFALALLTESVRRAHGDRVHAARGAARAARSVRRGRSPRGEAWPTARSPRARTASRGTAAPTAARANAGPLFVRLSSGGREAGAARGAAGGAK